ncbi:MAG: exo-alpha-sialidase [Bacteroidales bacterium]|nr:exo-alpha-sialidase [Bacteroidales bacterium]
MKTCGICLTLLAIMTVAGCKGGNAAKEAADPSDISADLIDSCFIYTDRTVINSCHASTLVETSDGVLAAWFGGAWEGHPSVNIYTSRYSGGTWSEPVEAANGVETEYVRNPTWNPVLHKLSDSRMVLYYKVGPCVSRWAGDYKISEDDGHSWSERRKIPDNLLGPIKNKPITLSNGDILYPTSIEYDGIWKVYIEKSDRNLDSWRKIPVENSGFNAIQPAILKHGDGSLQMLCRSRDSVIVQSWSKDEGETWSAMSTTALPNNNSGLDAVTTSTGIHLLIYNPITSGRYKLALAGSHDGVNWKDLLVLENDPDTGNEYSYPAIIEGHDGTIYVSYTYKRQLIKFAIIRLNTQQ